mgnify:CR=1 FL=1|jgi:stage V sporulation protein G
MKIDRMNKGSWGKVRAFFDLTTQDGFIIKGFKLIEGINGLFVSMPSQKGNDDEYYDTVWVESKQLRDELGQLAIECYQNETSESLKSPSSEAENSGSARPEPEVAGSNISENNSGAAEEAPAAFSDDDIPF